MGRKRKTGCIEKWREGGRVGKRNRDRGERGVVCRGGKLVVGIVGSQLVVVKMTSKHAAVKLYTRCYQLLVKKYFYSNL